MTQGLFSKGLDEIASRWLKNVTTQVEPAVVRTAILVEQLALAESLVFSPKAVLKVYGENVVLPQIVQGFGVAAVEKLLDAGALEFVLWSEVVTKTDDEGLLRQGIDPLQSGTMSSLPHCNAEASVEMGLRGWAPKLTTDERARLTRLAVPQTQVARKTIAKTSVEAIRAAYDKGGLVAHGFDPSIPRHELDAAGRQRLCEIATQAMEAAIVGSRNADFYDCHDTWGLLVQLLGGGRRGAAASFEKILEMEGLPSIPALILDGTLSFATVAELREQPETVAFREWLWGQPDPSEAAAVSDAYLGEITKASRAKRKQWTKAARIASISTFGGFMGTLAGGPIGGLAGAAVGTGVGVGVSLLDGLVLDRLLGSRNPRRFVTDVLQPLLLEKRSHAGQESS